MSTIVSAPRNFGRIKNPFVSCSSARSPVSNTAGCPAPCATPSDVDNVPSMPLAPRLQSGRSPRFPDGTTYSTSRTGIEFATYHGVPAGKCSASNHAAFASNIAAIGAKRASKATRTFRSYEAHMRS